MLKPFIAAVGLTIAGAMATTAATAEPARIAVTPAVQTGTASADLLTPVKRWHRDDYRYDRYHDRRYYNRYSDYRYRDRYADYRYNRGHYHRPPAGWRGYSYRPYGWQTRGCIAAGPIWYCP